MDEELTPRIYREYCWFALLLLVLAISFVGRAPLGGTAPQSDTAGGVSAPGAHLPP